MKGTITKRLELAAGGQRIVLHTDYGSITGQWVGMRPSPGTVVHVEVEVSTVITVRALADGPYSVSSPEPDEILLVGTIDRWDEELLDLRIGDSLVSLECPAEPHQTGGWVEVRANGVRLFDTNL